MPEHVYDAWVNGFLAELERRAVPHEVAQALVVAFLHGALVHQTMTIEGTLVPWESICDEMIADIAEPDDLLTAGLGS